MYPQPPARFPGRDHPRRRSRARLDVSRDYRGLQLGRRTVEQSDSYPTNAELPNDTSSSSVPFSAPYLLSPLPRPLTHPHTHTLVQKSNNKLARERENERENVCERKREKNVCTRGIYDRIAIPLVGRNLYL